MKLRVAVVAVILAVIAGSCGEPSDWSGEGPEDVACVHFTNVLDDMLAKRLTEAEILQKLEEVDRNASTASGRIDNLPVPMLDAARNGSWGVVADNAEFMVMACAAIGRHPWSQRYQRPMFSSTEVDPWLQG